MWGALETMVDPKDDPKRSNGDQMDAGTQHFTVQQRTPSLHETTIN